MIVFSVIQIFLVVICTGISAILALLALIISRKSSFWIAKNVWAKFVCLIVNCKVEVSGKEILSKIDKPVIFCANHLSNFDIIAIYMTIDRPIYFIAKKELIKIPFLGWYMKAVGMIFIDRSNREKAMISMKKASELIKKGKNIITFPEGTRAKNKSIGTFKKGSFVIAFENKIPIVPIAIKNSDKINPDKSLKINKTIIKVSIGDIISDYKNFEKPIDVSKYTRKKVVELFKNI